MTIQKWGEIGKVLIPDLLHAPRGIFVLIVAVLLTAGLFVIDRIFPR